MGIFQEAAPGLSSPMLKNPFPRKCVIAGFTKDITVYTPNVTFLKFWRGKICSHQIEILKSTFSSKYFFFTYIFLPILQFSYEMK